MSNCGCGGGCGSLRLEDNITVIKGIDSGFGWLVNAPDGSPWDWTGWSAVAQARARAGTTGTPRQEWSTDDATIEFVDNVLRLVFTDDMTSAWDWSRAVYDIHVFNPDGEGPFYFAGGELYARDGVTVDA